MGGTPHLLTPEDGGAFLALMAAGRPWARPSWQRYFGLTPEVLEELRELSRGWFGKRQLHAWFAALGDRIEAVDVDGERAYVLAEHLDDLVSDVPAA